ncbi:MAG: hypothetical protein JXX28_06490 [Deltaproteobacteria bacterium]|nr:hypothetical protein [Deltaproteobacteria bacterium]
MARQPGTLILVALLAGCATTTEAPGAFDLPTAAAVLQEGGPFEEPVGYVASGRGGQIAALALKQGRFLSDDPTASFLRAAYLPTGAARLLSDVAVWSPAPDKVQVFAADKAFGQVLRVPHIDGTDALSAPAEVPVTHGEPVFIDGDGSGDAPSLSEVEVKQGTTTTELWTATSDGEVWWVEGSRSGPQPEPALDGVPYVATQRAIAFTITGAATDGDRFELSTASGVQEYEVGGRPLYLELSPEGSALAVVVHDAELDRPVLRWMDPVTGDLTGETELEDGACPDRMAWGGDTLYVADRCLPQVWAVSAPESAEAIPLPWPVFDVAPLLTDTGSWLYLAPTGGREVWVYDLSARALVDVNPDHQGVDGMDVGAAVRGLEAIPVPYRWPQVDDAGVNRWGTSVAVSLLTGSMVFLEEGSGCMVQDEAGPRTQGGTYGSPDYDTDFSTSDGPWLVGNGTNDRHVQVNPCAGVAREERWTLRYREVLQAWEVEGSVSGPQERLAFEDTRYVSDKGEVSFTLRAGNRPTEEGWTIDFFVLPGALRVDGDNDHSGNVDSTEPHLDLPGDPVFFWYDVGPTGAGWTPLDRRPFVLVPDEGSNMAGRVQPQTGEFEVVWD